MLFGNSAFQSVVERLRHEAEMRDVDENSQEEIQAQTLRHPFILTKSASEPNNEHEATTANPAQAYMDYSREEVPAPEETDPFEIEVQTPDHQSEPQAEKDDLSKYDYLNMTSLEDISRELAITSKDTLATLQEKRRKFARSNHPDLVPDHQRDNANKRMQATNLLIDQAIRLIEIQKALF